MNKVTVTSGDLVNLSGFEAGGIAVSKDEKTAELVTENKRVFNDDELVTVVDISSGHISEKPGTTEMRGCRDAQYLVGEDVKEKVVADLAMGELFMIDGSEEVYIKAERTTGEGQEIRYFSVYTGTEFFPGKDFRVNVLDVQEIQLKI